MLSSSSTFDEVKAAYLDAASWQEDQDVAKAKAFATACRMLILLLPRQAGHLGQSQATFDLDGIRAEMRAAQEFVAVASAGGSVRFSDFSDFR